MIEQNILHFSRFSDMSKWSATTSVFDGIKTGYPLVKLSKILTRVKEPITVEDNKLYTRVTVRLYGQGVQQRDQVIGKDIGTKRQFIARAGQLIISRIDARNGAFGIVPTELEGAIVTNDFWLFDVHDALPQYLMLVMSSELFQRYWQTQSSGTTNRQRVGEDDFLQSKIALPSIEKQEVLLNAYNERISYANTCDQNSESVRLKAQAELCQMLNVGEVTLGKSNSILHIASYKNLSNRWEWDNLSEAINKALDNCKYPVKQLGSSVVFVNRSWKKTIHPAKTFSYVEIGGINADDNSISSSEVYVVDAPSRATQMIKSGDLILGTTRPYLQRFAIVTDKEDNFVCSSGFQVIAPDQTYDLRYILEVLKINTTIKQFELLMTGALYPAVNTEQLKQIRIPFPPIKIQKEIADELEQEKNKATALHEKAENLRQRAKKEFEEAVFDGR